MPQEEDLVPPILFHLYRRKLWEASYTPKEKALSKLPKRLRGEGLKEIDKLVKRRLFLEHKGEECVSLNTKEKEKIMKILKEQYPIY